MAFFLTSLKESGKFDNVQITVGIVGSRKLSISDDYGCGGWSLLAPHLTIYGFDADLDACEAANADLEERQVSWQEKHIPIALSSSTGESPLYVTEQLSCTSLYPPNTSYLMHFEPIIPFSFKLNYIIEVETTTLDTYCQQEEIKEIDFLQLDVQGAELEVLKGASTLLKQSILAIKTEVGFSHLYIDQPLFSDVDTYLRSNGFTLFDIDGCKRYRRGRSPIYSKAHAGQLLDADAFYFRDLVREDITTPLKTPLHILKLACIADILDFPDYALELLTYLTVYYGDDPKYNLANPILQSLSQVSELVEQGLDTLPVVAKIRDRLK